MEVASKMQLKKTIHYLLVRPGTPKISFRNNFRDTGKPLALFPKYERDRNFLCAAYSAKCIRPF